MSRNLVGIFGSTRFPGEDSVLPAHNCSVWKILGGRPQGSCSCAKIQPEEGTLVVGDDIEEGAVDV